MESKNVESNKIMTDNEWSDFAKGELFTLLLKYNLETITTTDGTKRKAVLKRNKDGEIKIQITTSETL